MSKLVTLRGVATVPKVEKILLFDGSFETAYMIKGFKIVATNPATSQETAVRLCTVKEPTAAVWNWASNTEVAWAAWGVPTNTRFGTYSNWDEEAIIVEDLFLDAGIGTSNDTVNWELILEQVKVSDSQAALAMVNARSQGSD